MNYSQYLKETQKFISVPISSENIEKRNLRKHVARNLISSRSYREQKEKYGESYKIRSLTFENNSCDVVNFCNSIVTYIDENNFILGGKKYDLYTILDDVSRGIVNRNYLNLETEFELNEETYTYLAKLASQKISLDSKFRKLMVSKYFN